MKGRSQGIALLSVLILISSFSAVYMVRALRNANESVDMRTQRETQRALRDAQLALIAYAAIEDNTPGALPCASPLGTLNGTASGFSNCPSSTTPQPSRLPWHRLGLQRSQDGNAECVWYVLSPNYRNTLQTDDRNNLLGTSIKPSSAGQISLIPAAGTASPQVAVLIAPGSALATQTMRGAAAPYQCRDGATAQFLDTYSGVNNASDSGTLIAANTSDSFNDSLLPISAAQVLKPILRRALLAVSNINIRTEILSRGGSMVGHTTLATLRGTVTEGQQSFDKIIAGISADTDLSYPSGKSCPGLVTGVGTSTSVSYKHPASWLCFNDWYSHISYDGINKTLTLLLNPAAVSGYRCEMTLIDGLITCHG